MFIGHIAVGLAARRFVPRVGLAAWFTAAQLADLLWPICLLTGLEHVRIAPGITAFTPLDFYDYPITHSLTGELAWGVLLAALVRASGMRWRQATIIGAVVPTHWILDVVTHRPDVPVLPHGPYLGLSLWNSIAGTLCVELAMFATGLMLYVSARPAGARRPSFWLLMGFLLVAYFAAAFGPPSPNEAVLAWSALSAWLLLPWAWWADRDRPD
jgi:hypothetical protein